MKHAPKDRIDQLLHAHGYAGRRSRVNIMNIAPERDVSIGPAIRSGAANTEQGFEIGGAVDCPPVPPACAKH